MGVKDSIRRLMGEQPKDTELDKAGAYYSSLENQIPEGFYEWMNKLNTPASGNVHSMFNMDMVVSNVNEYDIFLARLCGDLIAQNDILQIKEAHWFFMVQMALIFNPKRSLGGFERLQQTTTRREAVVTKEKKKEEY